MKAGIGRYLEARALLGEANHGAYPLRREGKRAEASLRGATVNLRWAIRGVQDQALPDPLAHNSLWFCVCLLLTPTPIIHVCCSNNLGLLYILYLRTDWLNGVHMLKCFCQYNRNVARHNWISYYLLKIISHLFSLKSPKDRHIERSEKWSLVGILDEVLLFMKQNLFVIF